MRFDLRILGGTVVSSAGQSVIDVGVRNGTIIALGDLSSDSSDQTIDAAGKLVLPGGIDTQVHFREPGPTHKEDIESGSRGAILGGITTFFEMPNTDPTTTTAEALQAKVDSALATSWADFGFFVGASTSNIDELAQLEILPGTPGVKIFMGSSTGTLLVDDPDDLRRVFENTNRRTPLHSEDEARLRARKSLISDAPHPREHPFLRDAEAAVISTKLAIDLSEKTGHPIHILHVSTGDEIPLIADAKARALGTTCEVTPQHLFFCAEDYERLGTRLQMNPPIRSAEHRDRLWEALNAGIFDVFGSDHAPHTLEEKAKPYPESPSGMPGVQTILLILLEFVSQGRLTLEKLVKMLCENPCALYGIDRKGYIRERCDADLVIVDPKSEWTITDSWIQSKCGWTPYDGVHVHNKIEHVFLRGQHVVSDGKLMDRPAAKAVTYSWKGTL